MTALGTLSVGPDRLDADAAILGRVSSEIRRFDPAGLQATVCREFAGLSGGPAGHDGSAAWSAVMPAWADDVARYAAGLAHAASAYREAEDAVIGLAGLLR
ncbi:MAG: hypothetical protein V9F04_12115 [Dermatophilaceae bacterium]